MEAFLTGAFLIGVVSTLHCIGMCGGIVGALTFSLPAEVRAQRWRMLPYVSAYNVGRVTSYTAAGALSGLVGDRLSDAASPHYGYLALQVLAALILAAIALHLAGWFPRFAAIERIGVPLWRRIEPLGRLLLPVRSPLHAWLFGLIWGWLPCGLVYSMLVWTATSGSALRGALYMLAFGVGTLPSVMTAGILTTWFTRFSRLPWVRPLVGALILVIALAGLYLNFKHGTEPDLSRVSSPEMEI